MEIAKFTIDLVSIGMFGGYMLFVFGILLLLCPKILIKISNYMNKFMVNLDQETYKHRIISGIISIILSLIIFISLHNVS